MQCTQTERIHGKVDPIHDLFVWGVSIVGRSDAYKAKKQRRPNENCIRTVWTAQSSARHSVIGMNEVCAVPESASTFTLTHAILESKDKASANVAKTVCQM